MQKKKVSKEIEREIGVGKRVRRVRRVKRVRRVCLQWGLQITSVRSEKSVAVDGSLVVVVSSCPIRITVSPEKTLRYFISRVHLFSSRADSSLPLPRGDVQP